MQLIFAQMQIKRSKEEKKKVALKLHRYFPHSQRDKLSNIIDEELNETIKNEIGLCKNVRKVNLNQQPHSLRQNRSSKPQH